MVHSEGYVCVAGRWSRSAQRYGFHKTDGVHDDRHHHCCVLAAGPLLSAPWELSSIRSPYGRSLLVLTSLWSPGSHFLHLLCCSWSWCLNLSENFVCAGAEGAVMVLLCVPCLCWNCMALSGSPSKHVRSIPLISMTFIYPSIVTYRASICTL